MNKYNERDEKDILRSEVLEGFSEEMIELIHALKKERESEGTDPKTVPKTVSNSG